MQTTPANLNILFSGIETRFSTAFTTAKPYYTKIATIIPSSTEQMVYGWMGQIDKARVWTGSRQAKTPGVQTYVVPNVPFELTQSVDKFKIQDDSYGIYFPLAQRMGEQAKKIPDYQLRDLLNNVGNWTGTFQNGLDGLTHWNTAHPVDYYDSSKGTYCNDFTGGGVTINGILTGGALAPNAYATLYQEMAARKSESGEALGILPTLTWGPPQLDITAKTLLNAQFFAPAAIGNLTGNVGATENMLKGSTDWLLVPEYAAYPTVWYMGDTSRDVMPLIWQSRVEPFLVIRNQENDPVVFDSHSYAFGIEARGAPAWGPAFLSSRSGT